MSQRRISVSDLKDGQIIADYEKEHANGEYAKMLEDTTVNYFYALYLLSRCDAMAKNMFWQCGMFLQRTE